MKENKSRFPWRKWARFEVIDIDGGVWQSEAKPMNSDKYRCWDIDFNRKAKLVGSALPPFDYTTTLIERYPSDQSETAPAETDAPDLQAKVKELERFSLGVISDNIKIRASIEKTEARIEVLEAEVKELRESREMVHRLVPARTYLDDMRFVVPNPQNEIGILGLQDNTKAKAEPDAAIDADETTRPFCKVQGDWQPTHEFPMLRHKLTFIESDAQPEPDPTAQIAQLQAENEQLRKIKQFPWTIEYKSTPIDPTAQKVEALKLLFPWRDGCEFMTVDGRDGHVWQWTVEPIKGESNCWSALGSDPQARRVGEIGLDPELCKILIKRNDGE